MPFIEIYGARQHNLNIDVLKIPRDQLVVMTGVSGSGKSSLAFDTIYAEGQRRYIESLSAYARQFLNQNDKPNVEKITGLSPSIAIDQKSTGHNPRSTVGTLTEIYDYLRLLYARIGQPHCPQCQQPIHAAHALDIVRFVQTQLPPQSKFILLAPAGTLTGKQLVQHMRYCMGLGFIRVRIDGHLHHLQTEFNAKARQRYRVDIVIDRLVASANMGSRLHESIALALRTGKGTLIISPEHGDDIPFSEHLACNTCNIPFPIIEPRHFSFNNPLGACEACNGLGHEPTAHAENTSTPCPACAGSRLNTHARHVWLQQLAISDLCAQSIPTALQSLENIIQHASPSAQTIAAPIVRELRERLQFLISVGLSYLSLDRPANTLSGGESQRIRLATQIGSALQGVIYVLDEPSIGLHQRDNHRLLQTLFRLRDLGNSVIVVEHDEDTMRAADWIIDVGPRAGIHGGKIIASGPFQEIIKHPESLTAAYLTRKRRVEVPKKRRPIHPERAIVIEKAQAHNLQTLNVTIPTGVFVCVTGVSGSGKSTLIHDTLAHYLRTQTLFHCQAIHYKGPQYQLLEIDQSPIGRTPRSNPATYTQVFNPIRELFALIPESRARGYTASRFSFNVKGGRCEACQGDGVKRVEMHFLADVFVTCAFCQGLRYQEDVLEILFKGKNIAEVLSMTVAEAAEFFSAQPLIARKLKLLNEVGLDYLQLGQASNTLSGGEAQRIKLARELSRRSTHDTLYILDEPTTGLHFDDVAKLLNVLHRLVDQGSSVVVIEHNLDVIKTADHIIDLGPDGGTDGGNIIATGTPEAIAQHPLSYTGKYLQPLLT
jgi:excinuclease ABC subunit A